MEKIKTRKENDTRAGEKTKTGRDAEAGFKVKMENEVKKEANAKTVTGTIAEADTALGNKKIRGRILSAQSRKSGHRTSRSINIVLIIGFIIVAILGYKASDLFERIRIEQISSLTTEGISYRLSSIFNRPVNISTAMANDRMLANYLKEEPEEADEDYTRTIREYLEAYHQEYGFDAVFMVSAESRRYYNFNGLDRVLEEDDPEDTWYFDLLKSEKKYALNVDNDEVEGADNQITTFVNCKIFDTDGAVLGVIGAGIRVDTLREILQEYEQEYEIEAALIDPDGVVEISTRWTGYEHEDWFEAMGLEQLRKPLLSWEPEAEAFSCWTSSDSSGQMAGAESYVVACMIPELSWYLVVSSNTGDLLYRLQVQTAIILLIMVLVILAVRFIVDHMIKNYDSQLDKLKDERQKTFAKATEKLYDNIYELNISKNCTEDRRTQEYFHSLGAGELPYDEALKVIAEKQIKEEFREEYIRLFSTENIKQEYHRGNDHLRYDFMAAEDGINYSWVRIDVYIYYLSEDSSIHMFSYHKNIDKEKQQEQRAMTDDMTGFYSRMSAERLINRKLEENPEQKFAFFLLDIDHFKHANDCFGHVFGDYCICRFVETIRRNFREGDVLARVGGDEFVIFIPVKDENWVKKKAEQLSREVDMMCSQEAACWHLTVSMGISLASRDGSDFGTLYANADKAMYQAKKNGRNGFMLYNGE